MNSGCSALTKVGSQVSAQPLHGVVPPGVASGLHRHLAAGAPVDDDVLDRLAAAHAERFVDHRLERNLLAAAELPVGRDHGHGARVDDAFLHALRGEAAEHHRVRRGDARAGLHRHDRRIDIGM